MIITTSEQKAIERAKKIIAREAGKVDTDSMTSPSLVREKLKTLTANLTERKNGILILNNRHNLLSIDDSLSLNGFGTNSKDVIERIIDLNGNAAILFYLYPKEDSADITDHMVRTIKGIARDFECIDLRLLDAISTNGVQSDSFAERGLM